MAYLPGGQSAAGAARLIDRGAARLEAYAATDGPTYGLDLAATVACARERSVPPG